MLDIGSKFLLLKSALGQVSLHRNFLSLSVDFSLCILSFKSLTIFQGSVSISGLLWDSFVSSFVSLCVSKELYYKNLD